MTKELAEVYSIILEVVAFFFVTVDLYGSGRFEIARDSLIRPKKELAFIKAIKWVLVYYIDMAILISKSKPLKNRMILYGTILFILSKLIAIMSIFIYK